MYMRGDVPQIETAWQRALELAERLNDPEYRLASLWGLWSFHMPGGQHRFALDLANRFRTLAATRPDSHDRLIAEQMIGMSHHYMGDQAAARRHLERMIADYVESDRISTIGRYQIHLGVMARVFLARIAWLQGFPDRALRTIETGISDATIKHTTSLCYALAIGACPVALLASDLNSAGRYADALLAASSTRALARWHSFGRCFQGLIAMRRGDIESGHQLLRAGLDELGNASSGLLWLIKLFRAEALTRAGHISSALVALDDAFEPCEHTEERWRMPELLRIKGELTLVQDETGGQADDYFRQAIDWSRRQGALSWELRAATSLARRLRQQDREGEALAMLQPVYDRFTEGFGTADLKAAKELIDTLV